MGIKHAQGVKEVTTLPRNGGIEIDRARSRMTPRTAAENPKSDFSPDKLESIGRTASDLLILPDAGACERNLSFSAQSVATGHLPLVV